jgi:hypothetical protein
MAKNLSNRQNKLSVGIKAYTESQTVVDIIGKVGIGTTIASATLAVRGQVNSFMSLENPIVTVRGFNNNGGVPTRLLTVGENPVSSWNTHVGIGTSLPLVTISGYWVPELSVQGTIMSTESIETTGDLWVENDINIMNGSLYGNYIQCSSIFNSDSLTVNGTSNLGRVAISSYLSVSGVTSFYDNVHHEYDKAILIGNNNELQLYHNATNSYIDNSSGNNLILRTHGGSIQLDKEGPELMGVFNTDGSVELYYNNSKKFETTSIGATVFGTLNASNINIPGIVTATQFVGDGSGLTGIVATGSGVVIQEEGFSVGTASTINFVGTAVTATISGGIATIQISSGVSGGSSQWVTVASGIYTGSNVGIGTTVASSKLTVEGDGRFSGVVTASRFESTSAGTPTIDSPNNLNINAINVAISTDITIGRDAYVGVNTSSGLVLTSPNGTQYRLVVDNSGNLSTVLVP